MMRPSGARLAGEPGAGQDEEIRRLSQLLRGLGMKVVDYIKWRRRTGRRDRKMSSLWRTL